MHIGFYSDSAYRNMLFDAVSYPMEYTSLSTIPSSVDTGRGRFLSFPINTAIYSPTFPRDVVYSFKASDNLAPDFITAYAGGRISMRFKCAFDSQTQVGSAAVCPLSVGSWSGSETSVSGGEIYGHFVEFDYAGTEFIGCILTADAYPGGYSQNMQWAFEKAAFEDAETMPYQYPQDAADPDGGYGTGTIPHERVTAGSTPTAGAPFGNGINAYRITPTGYGVLQNFLWGKNVGGSNIYAETFKALWQKFQNKLYNPVASILACHRLPSAFTPAGGASSGVSVGGLLLPGTQFGANCKAVSMNFIDVSLSCDIPQAYGSFMDYIATHAILHVPFCGSVSLDPSAVIGGGLEVLMRCDPMTGNVCAMIEGRTREGRYFSVGDLTGNAAYQTPVVGHNDGQEQILGSLASSAVGVAAMAASGAAGLGERTASALFSAGSSAALSGLDAAMHVQRETQIFGNVAGSAAMTTKRTAYVEIYYAAPAYPRSSPDHPDRSYFAQCGVPASASGTVGSFPGRSEFIMHADGISGATDDEKREIESLLREGVIV